MSTVGWTMTFAVFVIKGGKGSRALCATKTYPYQGGGPTTQGRRIERNAAPQTSAASTMTDRRKAWRFPKLRGWFRHKWRPAEAARPRTMQAGSHRPGVARGPVGAPYVVLSCEGCGLRLTRTPVEVCGRPG